MGYKLELSQKRHTRNWVVTVKGNVREEAVEQMTDWCFDQEIGRRMSYDQFVFHSKEDATKFYLSWIN